MVYGKIKIEKGDDAGQIIQITTLPFFLGRLDSNHLVLIDEKVSRQHAKIDLGENDSLVLHDLKSRNGLLVNGEKKIQHTLSHGDTIDIGSIKLTFQSTEAAPHLDNLAEPTQENPVIPLAPISVDIHPLLLLLRSQLPAKAIAVQVINYVSSRFQAHQSLMYWRGEPEIWIKRIATQDAPDFKSFDLPTEAKGILTQTEIVHGKATGCMLISPFTVHSKTYGWLIAQRAPQQPVFSQKDKTDFQLTKLIAEAAMERAEQLTLIQQSQKKLQLMEKYVAPEVLKDIFAKDLVLDSSPLDVEEKEVTILFTDIQGFTSLSERLPAREIAELLNEYFQRMVEVITRNNGSINKFIGDAIMALFGAPKSHGNDAANAVNAALEMVEELKRFWKNVAEHKRFNMRIGINTGRVVVGNIGSAKKLEYTVLGDAVNVASRLESKAEANGILIGARTAHYVQDTHHLESIPGLKVKGKAQEIDVFKVVGKK